MKVRAGHDDFQVVLILQGGGALGAYQVGAFQAMHEAGYEPDWVSGISIGAINSAVIVGNPPDQRVGRLEDLWNEISRPNAWGSQFSGELLRLFNQESAMEAILFGQPNFFFPRVPNPFLVPPGLATANSVYDTSPMLATLARLADFDRINTGKVRLTLGATCVTTGTLEYFDNTLQRITPAHVLASGSLPPGFPPTQVDGLPYWDGGCVANSPLDAIIDDLEAVLRHLPKIRALLFMIDLWSAEGPEPTSINEVLWRQKQIQYATRSFDRIQAVARRLNLLRKLFALANRLPREVIDSLIAEPEVHDLLATGIGKSIDVHIVHIIYKPGPEQIPQSDTEFSRPSIAARRAAGYVDLKRALEQAPWYQDQHDHGVVVVHRVEGGKMRSLVPSALLDGAGLLR
jgi:NTE family protein